MRMIDGDKLCEMMYHEAFETDTDLQKWDSGCWIRYKLFENVIQKLATGHNGKWIPIKKGDKGYSAGDFICSECGKPNRCYCLTDYCSNCGSKMEV